MSTTTRQLKTYAVLLAALGWISIILQCYLSLQLATQNGKSIGIGIAVFLSYFTVFTNLLICISLTLSLLAPLSLLGLWFSRPAVVSGIAANIAFVALSYHFLLRNIWTPQGAQLVADVLLHYVVPGLYLLYWWLGAAKATLRWTHPVFWSVYPIAYLAYALIRGLYVGAYPYPFIDVADLGYARTTLNLVWLLSGFICLSLLIVALSRFRQHRAARCAGNSRWTGLTGGE